MTRSTVWASTRHEALRVRPVVISPSRSGDSKRVVSGSDDETVRVWLVETGELAFEPIKCHGQVWRVRYSPDGERIASGAVSVQIWDAQTGNGILSIKDSPIFSLSWTPDSDQIISGYFGEIIKWNSRTGDQIWRRKTPQDNTALSLSLNGTHLATCDWSDKSAILYDVTAGEHLTAFQHDEGIQDIVYSSSGQFLATVSNDKKVYVWVAPPLEDPQSQVPSKKPSGSSFLDLPAVIHTKGPSGETGIREIRRDPVQSLLDVSTTCRQYAPSTPTRNGQLPATSRPSRYAQSTGPTTSTHRRSLRDQLTGLFRRSSPQSVAIEFAETGQSQKRNFRERTKVSYAQAKTFLYVHPGSAMLAYQRARAEWERKAQQYYNDVKEHEEAQAALDAQLAAGGPSDPKKLIKVPPLPPPLPEPPVRLDNVSEESNTGGRCPWCFKRGD